MDGCQQTGGGGDKSKTPGGISMLAQVSAGGSDSRLLQDEVGALGRRPPGQRVEEGGAPLVVAAETEGGTE